VLKYIFAAVFILLAWALVLVFKLPLWPAILVTALIVLGLAAWVIFKMLASKRAASAIEAGLRAQAAKQNEGMRPDLAAEIAAMQAEFNKAVAGLKSSKLGRTGRDALGLLPWYVMIGPPGSGKTTAIRNSGLKFPQGRTGVVRGVGGTRNCDWWMTNEAIMLDTAGRWSTEDDDQEEWLAFLDLLKKTRPGKPINGIMLAVSATHLQGTDEEIQDLARKLRERIDEVIGRLDMVVPVYLIITKCDLVSGFVEIFGDLKDKERGEIWGFSNPLFADRTDNLDGFARSFDELTDTVERYSVLRMGEERRVDARERIYAFPQQFDSLRQGLTVLVSNLFAASVYHDAPIMRGVYFTSGTQEGRPVDRIMASMAEAFGVRPKVVAAPPAKPKSYFLRDVFQLVVFPDRAVAVRSTRVLRKQRILRWALAGGALAVSSAFLVLPISSYLENMSFVSDSRAYVERLAQARAEPGPAGPFHATTLEGAEPMATRLAKFADSGPDVSLRFGLYPGDRLMDPLQDAVEGLLIMPILETDTKKMQEFARGRGDTDASAALAGLMLHLLLTQPKAADEPSPDSDGWTNKWVATTAQLAAERWDDQSGGTATTKSKKAIDGSLRFYGLRIATAADQIERNNSVVSRVRTTLIGANEGDPLADLLRDPSMPRDIKLIDLVGGAITVFETSTDKDGPSVPGAFTPAGWEIVKTRIEKLAADREDDENSWVLGASRKRLRIDEVAVHKGYFRRYVDSWRSFLTSLAVKEPKGIEETRSVLKSMVMQKPLEAIWRNATKYLKWTDDSLAEKILEAQKKKMREKLGAKVKGLKQKAGVDDGAGGAGGGANAPRPRAEEPASPEDVGAEFAGFLKFGGQAPSGLDQYAQILNELSAAIGESGTPDAKAYETTEKALQVRLANLIANYNDNGWEAQLLQKILMPPFRGTGVVVKGANSDSANRKWCDSIVVIYDQLLAGKYPFHPKAQRDARVADVEKFFMPNSGALWQYYTQTLAPEIDHPAGTTLFQPKEGARIQYKPNLYAFLKRAQELTDLLFAKEPGKVGIPLGVRIRPSAPYTKIVFETAAKKIEYFNTKERWQDLGWPARGALFRFYQKSGEGELGYTDGEWALFHLVEDGRVTTASDGEEYLAGAWSPPLGEGTIRADLKPAGLLRAFRGLEMPRGIVVGTSGCGR
jgi:type VI secretion system protein ImpL